MIELEPKDGIQYGWDRTADPIARVADGETLSLEIRDASDGQIGPGFSPEDMDKVDRSRMNPLIGPIYVEGAVPGSAVQLDVVAVEPGRRGWTAIFPGFGLLSADFPDAAVLHWRITNEFAESDGMRIPTDPFCGVLGTCPAEEGKLSVGPPRRVGGNLDTRLLGPGAKVWLPVEVDGALLAIGDPHARQGDGEVCGTALETSASAVVKVSVRPEMQLTAPEYVPAPGRNATPRYATTGIGPDLFVAAQDAVRQMVEYLAREYAIEHSVAYMLSSLLVDLRISEIVDRPNWVVSAIWYGDLS